MSKSQGHQLTRLKGIRGSRIYLNDDYKPPVFDKSQSVRDFLIISLASNFVFCHIPEENLPILIDAFENAVVEIGTKIIEEGEKGDFFYVLEDGIVDFLMGGNNIGACTGGADVGGSFGDLALLYNSLRAATCLARTDCSLWRLDQDTFRYLQANYEMSESLDTKEHLRKVPFLKDLNEDYLNKLAYAVTTETFLKDEKIFNKGDPGDKFYVVREGKVAIKDIEAGGKTFEDQHGERYFGERALVTDEPRAATVVVLEDTTVFSISGDVFKSVLGSLSDIIVRSNDIKRLKGIQIFCKSKITDDEYNTLTTLVKDVTIPVDGEPIFSEGDTIRGALYIVRSGKVTVTSTKFDTKVITAGGIFGDEYILTEECKTERTAIVDETCLLGKLAEKDIYLVLGSRNRLSIIQDGRQGQKYIKYADLHKHRLIGKGAFGKVWLVGIKNAAQPETYALKIQTKRRLLEEDQVDGALREIEVMAQLNHPFIINMFCAYQDSGSIMILMGLVQGGELFTLMRRCKNGKLGENAARFYAAAILEAFIHMHNHRVVYRDLKPENILIGTDGFPVIVDFGFAKVVKDKTFTLCGTPYYIAPEIVLGRGHNKACDYWSLIVLLHEMIAGITPFQADANNEMILFSAIVRGRYAIARCVTGKATDLIKKVLVTNTALRLGNLAGGGMDIKKHPFFQAVNYINIIDKKVKVPYRPRTKDALDMPGITSIPTDPDENESLLTAKEKEMFEGFDDICTEVYVDSSS